MRRLVLVAPPPALLGEGAFAGLGRRRALVLVGAADTLAPPEALEAALEGVRGVELEVIPEADHFFATGLADLGRRAAAWLAR